MKLKIVHQNQESRKEEDHGMKKEALEMKKMEDAQIREDESVKENSQLLEPSPESASDPLLVSVSNSCLNLMAVSVLLLN